MSVFKAALCAAIIALPMFFVLGVWAAVWRYRVHSTRKARYRLKASEESESKGIKKASHGSKPATTSYTLNSSIVTLMNDKPASQDADFLRHEIQAEEGEVRGSTPTPVPEVQERVQLPRSSRRIDSTGKSAVEASPITPRSGQSRNKVHAVDDESVYNQVFPSQREIDREVIEAINRGNLARLKSAIVLGDIGINDPLDISSGRNALHIASAAGRTEIVLFLLEEAGANIMCKDFYGKDAQALAIQNHHLDLANYFALFLEGHFDEKDSP
eukprot:768432-Hanusia_phi.AAC.1